jgi:beta-glucosidase
MRKFLFTIALVFCAATLVHAQADAKMNSFVDNLMKKMTLEEKLGQLNLPAAGDITTGQAGNTDFAKKIREGKVGGLFNIKGVEKIREVQKLAVEESRLKIPLLFGMDVIHGYKTVFPIPLGLSATWDMQAIERSAQIAAKEASADGISWTFSPMVDIARDPRWGRMAEGGGEDPYLGGEIAKAMVRGYQGKNLKANNTILSCVKHFALYGAAEAGRDYNTTDMSRQRMYNEYFLPYKAAVDAGAGSVMASFNEVDGVPATANKWLMTDVLRKQWGFGGFVVSDYTAIGEMTSHGIGDTATVAARALMAGTDMDMVSEALLQYHSRLLKERKVTMAQIDAACRRILEAKYKLGLFEDPYRYCDPKRPAREVYTAENRSEARKTAAQSFVLLKNEGNVLPIKRGARIALVGPLANNRENMPGTWSVATDFTKAVSVLEGMKEVGGTNTQIIYSRGSNLDYDAKFEGLATMFGKSLNRDNRPAEQMIADAVMAARGADVVVAAVGESAEMSGECSSLTNLDLRQAQKDLLRALKATGKPIILVLFAGRSMTIAEEAKEYPCILNVWYPGSEAGHAIADVLFGDVNPSGKLTATWPQNLGQVPLFYNHKNTGRPLPEGKWFEKFKTNYLDVTNDPLYPFGFGLSYTTFGYGAVQLSNDRMKGNATLTASVQVTNTGKVAGKEVVQLYIRDVIGSTTRPVKELKGFEKVELKPGETKTVTFRITPEQLKFYNYDLKYDWEPGDFDIMIGANSRDVQKVTVNWQK